MVVTRNSYGSFCIVGDMPPDALGKFLDAQGALACLESEKVKFTPPKQLNDEWDCIPLRYRTEDVEKAWQHFYLSYPFPEQKQYFFENISTGIGVHFENNYRTQLELPHLQI